MFYVFVLKSNKDDKFYIGCTNDLTKRLYRHVHGGVVATKNRRPLQLIHSEEFENKILAFNRERFLKSSWGSREKQKMLKKFLSRGY